MRHVKEPSLLKGHECRASVKICSLHWKWWRLQMSEKLSSGTKNSKQKTNQALLGFLLSLALWYRTSFSKTLLSLGYYMYHFSIYSKTNSSETCYNIIHCSSNAWYSIYSWFLNKWTVFFFCVIYDQKSKRLNIAEM